MGEGEPSVDTDTGKDAARSRRAPPRSAVPEGLRGEPRARLRSRDSRRRSSGASGDRALEEATASHALGDRWTKALGDLGLPGDDEGRPGLLDARERWAGIWSASCDGRGGEERR